MYSSILFYSGLSYLSYPLLFGSSIFAKAAGRCHKRLVPGLWTGGLQALGTGEWQWVAPSVMFPAQVVTTLNRWSIQELGYWRYHGIPWVVYTMGTKNVEWQIQFWSVWSKVDQRGVGGSWRHRGFGRSKRRSRSGSLGELYRCADLLGKSMEILQNPWCMRSNQLQCCYKYLQATNGIQDSCLVEWPINQWRSPFPC